MKRFLLIIAAALCALLATTEIEAAQNRVVAVGDVHGEYDGFVSILQRAGLIDGRLRWSGGRATLVQTGDYFDRGAHVRKVLDLMMSLENAAARRRGRVIVLLGNHELMNLTGVMVDINPQAYAAFADRNSEKRRQAGYRDYVALHQRLAGRYEKPPKQLTAEEWLKAHPPGMIEYHAALAPQGKYGRWLRSKGAMVQLGDTVFVHAGVSPELKAESVKTVNDQVRLEMEAFDRIKAYLVSQKLVLPFSTLEDIREVLELEGSRPDGGENDDMRRVVSVFRGVFNWSIFDHDGPLWFRGFGYWTEDEGERHTPPLLARFGARHFVVGHTIPPDPSRILSRFGGKVFLIDTAMLRGYVERGRASALEIDGSNFFALYENEREELRAATAPLPLSRRPDILLASMQAAPTETPAPAAVWEGPDGKILPFRSSAEVAQFLQDAKVTKVDRKRLAGVTKARKLTVENGGVQSRAVFRVFHREQANTQWESGAFTEMLRDSWKSEIAAYDLAMLLGMNTIPPTVPWQMKKEQGSLQLWIENAKPGWRTESEKPPDLDRWQKQVDMMRVFDAVIRNMDRHEANMLIGPGWKLWWIDHSRSFLREHEVPDPELVQRTDRRMYERLKKLDPEVVTRLMQPWMGPEEIEALLVRREKVIALLDQRISEKGESEVLFTLEGVDIFLDPPLTTGGPRI
jgi:hypothetical protein